MAPLDRIFEFTHHESVASLEAPLGRSAEMLERVAASCDTGEGYSHGYLMVRRKWRTISVPGREVDVVHRRINTLLFPVDLAMGNEAHGYVARRSILTNALPHVGASHLHKFDIKDFFNSVTTTQIASALLGAGFGPDASAILSRLVSSSGRLPLGARTSPRISNLILRDFDLAMAEAAEFRGLVYTRYADDLSFSGSEAPSIDEVVESALNTRGFVLNPEKSRKFKRGQPMFVTGLSINDSRAPRLRKRFKSRLRQELYYVNQNGVEDHASAIDETPRHVANRLMGQFNHARSIEPDFTARLAVLYPEAYKTLIPERRDDRIARIQRYRAEFLREVLSAPSGSLPMYVPAVALRPG